MEITEIEEKLTLKKKEFIGLLPKKFKNIVDKNCYLCGGCIYSLRHDQEPKDYDIFLRDENLAKDIVDYFTNAVELKHSVMNGIAGFYKGHSVIITKYAISIDNFQIIVKYVGEPEDVLGEFDFKHNMFYFDKGKVKNIANWSCLESNKLVFNDERARDICGTIMRIPKFVKRGMEINKREIAKMLRKLEENGFDDDEKEVITNYSTY
jgi:hypothetical protein